MAANLYQLGIGIQATDEASIDIDRVSGAMQGLFESVDQLRSAGVDVALGGIGQAASDLANSLATDYQSALGGIAPLAEAATAAVEEQSDATVEAITNQTEAMQEAKAEAEPFFETLKNGFKDFGDALTALEGKRGFSDMMLGFGDSGFGAAALEFEDSTQKIATQLGLGAEGAQGFRDEISASVGRTQYAVGEYLSLATGLGEVGVAFSSLTQESQDNAVALANSFGLSGQQIGQMTRLIPQMGGEFEDTIDSVVGFSKAVGVDAKGALQALPDAVQGAREATAQFSSDVVGSGPQIVKSLMKTGAVFSKVFGKDMAEAVGEARQNFDLMTGELNSFANVFIGMEDDFGPLTNGLMETGMSLFEIQDLMKQGQDDPVAFAGSIRELSASLGEGSVKQRRMMEALRQGGVPMTLIRDTDAYNSAVEAQIELNRQQSGELGDTNRAFEDLTKGVLDTAKEMKSMFSNVKEGIMTTLHTAGVVAILNDALEGAKDTMASFMTSISKYVRSDEFKGWVEKLKPALAGIGKGFLLLGTAVSAGAGIVGTIASIGTGLVTMGAGALVLRKPFKLLTGSLSTFAGTAGSMTRVLGAARLEVGAVGTGVGKLGKGIAWLGGIFPWVGKKFAAFLGKFTFFSKMADTSRRAGSLIAGTIKGLGGTIAGAAGKIGSGLAAKGGLLASFFSRQAGKLASTKAGVWVAGIFSRLGATMTKLGAGVAAKGGFLKMFGRAIPGLGQIIAVISGVVTAVKDMGEVISDPNASGAEKFQALLRGLFKGGAETINSLFLGIPGMILKKFFPGMERTFDRGFAGIMDKVFGGDGLSATLGKWWDKGVSFFSTALAKLPGFIKSVTPSIGEFGKTIGGVIGGLGQMLWDVTVAGIKLAWKFSPIKMIIDMMTSDDAAVEEGHGFMLNTMFEIAETGWAAMKSAGAGILDGFLASFGSSLDLVILKSELAWVGIKNTMSETWNGIKTSAYMGWIGIGNSIMSAVNAYMIDPINLAIKSLVEAFPKMFKSVMGDLILFVNSVPNSFPGATAMKAQVAGVMGAIDAMAANAPQMERAVVKTEAELLSIRNKYADAQLSTEEKASAARELALAGEISRTEAALKTQAQTATDLRDWKTKETLGMDAQLEQFRQRNANKLDTRQMDAAQTALQDHLDATMRTLSKGVRSGSMTLDNAKAEWIKESANAHDAALRAGEAVERRAADRKKGKSAADAANAAGANRGLGPDVWRKFMSELTSAQRKDPSTQGVRVTLRGGDVLTRDIIKRSTQEAADHGQGN